MDTDLGVCGFIPPTPGFGPCTRRAAHASPDGGPRHLGPCAHAAIPPPPPVPFLKQLMPLQAEIAALKVQIDRVREVDAAATRKIVDAFAETLKTEQAKRFALFLAIQHEATSTVGSTGFRARLRVLLAKHRPVGL